jgi:hypothetical protein
MMLSKDSKIPIAIQWFAESERQHRCIREDADSKHVNQADEHGKKGTSLLIARTRNKCSKVNIGLRLTKNDLILKTSELE